MAHERLTRICFNDYDREIALVAETTEPKTGRREILGVGRLSKVHGANEAEFALLVSDRCQKQGLGTELLKRLVQIGREEKLDPHHRGNHGRQPRHATHQQKSRVQIGTRLSGTGIPGRVTLFEFEPTF